LLTLYADEAGRRDHAQHQRAEILRRAAQRQQRELQAITDQRECRPHQQRDD
jgi:hypothetical protein